MVRLGTVANGAETRLDKPERCRIGAQQFNKFVGPVLGDRVLEQGRALDRAAPGADFKPVNVGRDGDGFYSGRRVRLFGCGLFGQRGSVELACGRRSQCR